MGIILFTALSIATFQLPAITGFAETSSHLTRF